MNLAELGIILAAAILLVREVRLIRKSSQQLRKEASWPQFEEAYISALQSGISIGDSFAFVSDFNPPTIAGELETLVFEIDRGQNFVEALKSFRQRIRLEYADLFVEILIIAYTSGGGSLVSILENHVREVRYKLSAGSEIRARQNAILSVAKFGLTAPWILVAVLSSNETTRNSFNEPPGQLVLLGGFALSLLAYRLVVRAGAMTTYRRVIGMRDGQA